MKRMIYLILCLLLVTGMLAACSKDDSKNEATPTIAPTAEPTKPEEPEPTKPEDPEPTQPEEPQGDPNDFITADFESDSSGTLITSSAYPIFDPSFTYMFFQNMGNAYAEYAEGKGVDGGNCMVVTGRASDWNGISITVPEELFGKSLKISYDAYYENPDITSTTISLTSKFMMDIDRSEERRVGKEC